MDDAPRPHDGDPVDAPSPAGSARNRIARAFPWAFALTRAICFVVANAAVLFLIRLVTWHTPLHVQWWVQVVLAVSMLWTSAFVALHLWLHWAGPARRAAKLLPLVRDNEAPIEELGSVGAGGALAELVTEVQETLRELRRQRAELEREARQRVANRTDALERSLGVLRQQASRDALTGLLNRRSLDETLPKVLDRCRAEGMALSLLMADVDRFKPLNDALGHAAGDEFLRSLGQLFRSTLREQDLAFRYGGDEFVLVLPDATAPQADALARRLAQLADGLGRSFRVDPPPGLSIGSLTLADIAAYVSVEAFLGDADRLLYEIKAQRRGNKPRAA